MEKQRESYGMYSTRGAPPKNIFANQGGIGSDYRSGTPTDSYSFNSNTMIQEGRNPADCIGQSSSRSQYTREQRRDDDYVTRVSAEMRAGHRRTQDELLTPRHPPPLHRHDDNASFASNNVYRLEKELVMKESEINELKRSNAEKKVVKNAHYKHVERELAGKTSEIQDLKHQLTSMKLMGDEHLETKLGQQESKLLKVFTAELEKSKEEIQAEHEEEMEAVQQELADALDEIKFLKRGCEFVEHEAEASSRELEQVCHQNEEILAEMARLQVENEELSTENAELKERYDEVLHNKIERERLTKEVREELEDTLIEKTQLEGTVEQMEMEIHLMVEQEEAAKSYLDEALGENDENRWRCIQLQTEMDHLREEHRVESQLNNKVKEQRDRLENTVKDQQAEIEMLKERNEVLQREMDDLKNELLHTLDMASIYQKTHAG